MKTTLLAVLLLAACSDEPGDNDMSLDASAASDGLVNTIHFDGSFAYDGGLSPAWKANAPLGAFIAIPGTEGAGGAAIDAYSGFTLREDTAELFILAAGGHGDSSDNRVVSIDLRQDAPSWILRSAPSPTPTPLASYYSDGKPGSTHLYDYTAWVPEAGGTGRFMRFGMHGRYNDGGDNYNVDGFDPLSNTWDPAGTYPDVPHNIGNAGTTRDKTTGIIYCGVGTKQWTPGSAAWTDTTGIQLGRFPIAYDTKRKAFFSLQMGDGQGYGLTDGPKVLQTTPSTNTTRTITIAPSAAYTQFQSDQPQYGGMDYDQGNDRFLFFAGQSINNGMVTNVPTRIFVVTPSDGTTWSMDILAISAGGVTPEAPNASGIQGRFKYVPALGGFIYMARSAAPLYFLRTN